MTWSSLVNLLLPLVGIIWTNLPGAKLWRGTTWLTRTTGELTWRRPSLVTSKSWLVPIAPSLIAVPASSPCQHLTWKVLWPCWNLSIKSYANGLICWTSMGAIARRMSRTKTTCLRLKSRWARQTPTNCRSVSISWRKVGSRVNASSPWWISASKISGSSEIASCANTTASSTWRNLA